MVALALITIVITVPGFRSHIFALNFVDEDDNIVIGNYVREGKKLYTDVFSQHQPSMFILSSQIQKMTRTDNILMTIKRHREFMIAWSIIWFFILTLRFGWPILVPISMLELTKISLLGNLFLAEGLVVYPLLYLISYLIGKKNTAYNLESIFVTIVFWFLWFSLTPLWPLLIICLLWLFVKSDHRLKFALITFLMGALCVLYLSQYAGIKEYVYDALYINYKYYIPLTAPVGFFDSIIKAFLAPIYALLAPGRSELLLLIKVLSLGFILKILFLVLDKKYFKASLYFTVLGLSSLRYIEPGNTLYGAFHMLPWFVLLVLFNFSDFTHFRPIFRLRQIVLGGIYILIFVAAINISRINLWDNRDPSTDYYVHYSPSEDVWTAVKILSKNGGQTIWVEPVMYWPYWRTGTTQYSSMVNYYGWMDLTPPMKDEIHKQFSTELPTIVWATTTLGIGDYLSSYTRFKRDGQFIDLYLRTDKIREISEDVRRELEYYRFEIN